MATDPGSDSDRRRFLQTIGAVTVAGVAGCLGDDDDEVDDSDDEPIDDDDDADLDDEAPFFQVIALSPTDHSVTPGTTFEASALILNTGGTEDTQVVEVRIDDEVFGEVPLSLESGENAEVSFEVDTEDVAPGEYSYGIYSEDDGDTTTLTIEGVDLMGPAPAVLIFSVTGGFRHGAAIEAGNPVLAGMGPDMIDRHPGETEAEEVQIDVVDDANGDASGFPDTVEELEQYDVVVWHNTTGSILNDVQQSAFREYIENGGGYAGIHSASDTHYDWEWYGDLVGAYFDGHPAVQPAEIKVTDQVHPSTEFLPGTWERNDEWYDFDINPRGDVHVLATIDEDSYNGAGMSDGRVDHPITWCHEIGEGRSWYTGGGHTPESLTEEDAFVEHVMTGIMWAAGWLEGEARGTVWDTYEQVEIVGPDDVDEPMSMTFTPDGRIFLVQRQADVLVIDPETRSADVALERTFWGNLEDGGLGIAADPDFEDNGWIYLYYSPVDGELDPADDMPYNLLSRFEVDGDELDPDSEVEILRVNQQRDSCCHSAGELQFGPDRTLHLSTGDNVTPFESDGYTPIDERSTNPNTADAQGTSGDASDLRGNILRIIPHEDGSYSVPEDNLYTEAQGWGDEIAAGLVRPEIFAQGFRNPFRFDVDDETGWVYMADYGPDSGSWDADRGPIGIREYNQIQEAGNYGWPFTRARNYPYIDYDFETGESIGPFDPENLINDSVNNDGIEALPPAEEATFYVATSWGNYLNAPDDHDWGDIWDVPDQVPWPQVTDRAPNGGPLVRLPEEVSDRGLPEYFEGKWFIAEWNSGNFLYVTFDENGELLEISTWDPPLGERSLDSPHDLEISPNGEFYYIEWGSGFGGDQPGVYRIEAE